ncbi:MAG TPA: hypothetical protein VL242_44985 [Sorangium sp.]|nr:hypothetical protein [Sorangium sp.]
MGNVAKQASAALGNARQCSARTTGSRSVINFLHRHHKQHQQVFDSEYPFVD